MIYFAGDVHGQMHHLLPALQAQNTKEPKALILLGDIETSVPLEQAIKPLLDSGIDVWFIAGNHDTDQRHYWENLTDSQHRNLDGRVVDIQGVRVAGLGGVFRGEIWYPKNGNTEPNIYSFDDYIKHLKQKTPPRNHDKVKFSGRVLKHKSSIFPDTYKKLSKQRADILVTHEAPSCHPNGFVSIDLLAQSMGVKLSFHGHQHDNLDYSNQYETLGFKAFGVGLRGISDINGNCILAGELDEQRRIK